MSPVGAATRRTARDCGWRSPAHFRAIAGRGRKHLDLHGAKSNFNKGFCVFRLFRVFDGALLLLDLFLQFDGGIVLSFCRRHFFFGQRRILCGLTEAGYQFSQHDVV